MTECVYDIASEGPGDNCNDCEIPLCKGCGYTEKKKRYCNNCYHRLKGGEVHE